ncbi:MAG TPA: tetratricopeptide repeat protein [Bacteroidota bacterium]|nr:tetratricopeptide repeat protein [Bacteroidota bacterium]
MNKRLAAVGSTAAIVILFLLGSCHGSDESSKEQSENPPPALQPSATEVMQKEMAALRTTNDSLSRALAALQQENRTLAAHNAELESQLSQLKDKIGAAPQSPPPVVPAPAPVYSNVHEGYQHALELFRSRHYADAAALFQQVLDNGIPLSLQDNCTYWIGECEYGQKEFAKAIDQFQKVFSYKISEKKDDSQIMIGNSYLALGDKEKAKDSYEQLLKVFPASPFIKLVKGKLSRI